MLQVNFNCSLYINFYYSSNIFLLVLEHWFEVVIWEDVKVITLDWIWNVILDNQIGSDKKPQPGCKGFKTYCGSYTFTQPNKLTNVTYI
mgnify:CR=1 FL=1